VYIITIGGIKMYKEMKVKMPEEIYLILKKNEAELGKDLLLKAAIQYYIQDQLSLARASNMCGLSRLEFIDVLNSLNIPVFNYSLEDIDEIHEESSRIVERTG
jgi:predicted HTH domain antitoxin